MCFDFHCNQDHLCELITPGHFDKLLTEVYEKLINRNSATHDIGASFPKNVR